MADERLAREFRENFGVSEGPSKRVPLPAARMIAATAKSLFPAQSGGLRRAQRLAPHRCDHFGENGDGDLGRVNRADIEPDRA